MRHRIYAGSSRLTFEGDVDIPQTNLDADVCLDGFGGERFVLRLRVYVCDFPLLAPITHCNDSGYQTAQQRNSVDLSNTQETRRTEETYFTCTCLCVLLRRGRGKECVCMIGKMMVIFGVV